MSDAATGTVAVPDTAEALQPGADNSDFENSSMEEVFAAEEAEDAAAEASSTKDTGTSPDQPDGSDSAAAETGSDDAHGTALPEGTVPLQALLDERRKRQEAEVEAAHAKGLAEGAKKQPATDDEVETDSAVDAFMDYDPDKFVAEVDKRIAKAIEAQSNKDWEARAERNEKRVRKATPEYDTLKAEFFSKKERDPAWYAAIQSTEDWHDKPAEVVVETMKALAAEKAFDPAAERAKMRTELLAELKGEGVDTDLASLPKSQANATGKGPSAEPRLESDADDDPTDGGLFDDSY